MTTLRVVLVEDQAPAREHLLSLLSAHADVEVVAVCNDGRAAIEALAACRADVVLLDIQMPECNGFDVIRAVAPEHMPPVIFVTAYEDHAVHAFEVRALDYLVKPFTRARVDQALATARAHTHQRRVTEAAARLAALVAPTAPIAPADRLALKRREGTAFVDPGEVEFVRASRNDVILSTGTADYRYRATLTEMRETLGAMFVQVHRSMLVNFDHVQPVILVTDGTVRVRLTSGREVRVSSAFRADVEARLRTRG